MSFKMVLILLQSNIKETNFLITIWVIQACKIPLASSNWRVDFWSERVGYLPSSPLRSSAFSDMLTAFYPLHTGKCIRRFGGIYAYCRYLIDRKWQILVLILYRKTCHMPKGL